MKLLENITLLKLLNDNGECKYNTDYVAVQHSDGHIEKVLTKNFEQYIYRGLKSYKCPYLHQVQDFIIEKYNHLIVIDWLDDVYGYYYKIVNMTSNIVSVESKGYIDYNICLEQAIEEFYDKHAL